MAIENITITDDNGDPKKVAVDTFDTDNHAQIIKMAYGAEDAAPTLVSATDPLPVDDGRHQPFAPGAGDAIAGNVSLGMDVRAGTLVYNGSTWDRARGDITNGVDVDVTRLPALPAGDNNIGNVDVVTLPGVEGKAAADAAISGNPVQIGGRASTATPTAVSADGDAVPVWLTRLGQLIAQIGAPVDRIVTGTLNRTNTTGADIIAAQGAGVKIVVTAIVVTNKHATQGTNVSVRRGTTAVQTNYAAPAGGGWALQNPAGLFVTAANEAVTGICGTSGADVDFSVFGYTTA
jgi:hypothetical protein